MRSYLQYTLLFQGLKSIIQKIFILSFSEVSSNLDFFFFFSCKFYLFHHLLNLVVRKAQIT